MFICIWCEDAERGISKNNQIPWKIKEDLELFKQLTLNHTVVMGKNTYLSIGKPLPKRENVVISKTLQKSNTGNITVYQDMDAFLKKYQNNHEVIYIIGGKQIYDFFIPISQKLFISKLSKTYDCDLFMDNNFDAFELEKKVEYHNFTFYTYNNKFL